LFECQNNVFTCLLTYLTQLTHQNVTNTLLFARGRHANYKYYVGLNIAYKQYDRIIMCFLMYYYNWLIYNLCVTSLITRTKNTYCSNCNSHYSWQQIQLCQ